MEEKKTQPEYKMNSLKTIILMGVSGFLLMFLLVFGSVTNNRFGTHLLFSSDMIGSPVWFISIISIISIAILILAVVIGVLILLKKINLSANQNKHIRLGSYSLIGISAFMIGLSSICFAAFQNQFFMSQFSDGLSFNMVTTNVDNGNLVTGIFESKTTNQSMAIGIITIISIVAILSISLLSVLINKNMNDKAYSSVRNSSIAFLAIGWFVFNVNIAAYGSMGGDAAVLVAGITGISYENLEKLSVIFSSLGAVPGSVAWRFVSDFMTNLNISKDDFIDLWNNQIRGIFTFLSPLLISKEGLEGVNNSVQAYLIFSGMLISLVAVPAYGIVSYLKVENYRNSYFLNFLVMLIILVTILFVIESWVLVYAINSDDLGTVLPGLIAAPGEAGGIHSAVVYYGPNYHGTALWEALFILTILTVVVSLITCYFTTKYFNGSISGIKFNFKKNDSKNKTLNE